MTAYAEGPLDSVDLGSFREYDIFRKGFYSYLFFCPKCIRNQQKKELDYNCKFCGNELILLAANPIGSPYQKIYIKISNVKSKIKFKIVSFFVKEHKIAKFVKKIFSYVIS